MNTLSPRSTAQLLVLALMVGAGAAHAQDFLVSSLLSGDVLRYDEDGLFLGVFASGGGMTSPEGIAFGPDGDLYVADSDRPVVWRYHGETGAFLGRFVSDDPDTAEDETGGLAGSRGFAGLTFGPDDNLYVCGDGGRVVRYDGRSGAFIDVFAQDEQLDGAVTVAFGPDGDLYVASTFNDRVLVFDGAGGGFLRVFSSDPVPNAFGLAFDLGGDLYVSSPIDNQVVRLESGTGNSLGTFIGGAGLDRPLGLTFHPSRKRNLYLAAFGNSSIRRYERNSGRMIDELVAAGTGGIAGPHRLLFFPRETDCDRIEELKARCSVGGRISATVKSTLGRGTLLTLENNSLSKQLKLKKSGKGKARFRRQGGLHRLSLLECPAYRVVVDCG